jgi:predicted phosphodiesterase
MPSTLQISGNKAVSCLVLSFTLLAASCDKSFGIETDFQFGNNTTITITAGQIATSPKDQGLLLDLVNRRVQIAEVIVLNDVCTITFQGGRQVHLPCSFFPFISSEDGERWSVNLEKTDFSVLRDDHGRVMLPDLSIAEGGNWALDGIRTGVPADDYRSFAEVTDTVHLVGLAKQDERLFLYTSDRRIKSVPIIREGFYRVPEYWQEHLVEKEILAEAAITEAEGDCYAFVFFTDTHWGKNMKKSPSLIRHITDYTPISDVIFGGDVVTTHATNLVTPMETGKDFQASFGFLGTNFHCLYGNHDNNSDSQPNKTEYHLSEEQVYSFLQSQMTDVVYGNYYNFYYDKPQSKTRIICLDTGRYYYSQFRDKLPDTVSFAIEALSSVPEGWHVIMASHIWCSDKKGSDGSFIQYLGSFIKPVLKVFDDYNARLAGSYSYNNRTVPYDFTEAAGKIEFCIGGHTHADFTAFSDGGIPVIIVISDYSKVPQKGTAQEQSVTQVIADYKNRKLALIVVGRGKDRILEL